MGTEVKYRGIYKAACLLWALKLRVSLIKRSGKLDIVLNWKYYVYLRWLILCVNLTRPQGAWMFGHMFLWVCPLRAFLDDINIWMGRPIKADCPPWCGWASSNQLKTEIEQTGWEKGISCCLTALSWDTGFFFQSLNLNWKINSFWVSSLLAFRLTHTLHPWGLAH